MTPDLLKRTRRAKKQLADIQRVINAARKRLARKRGVKNPPKPCTICGAPGRHAHKFALPPEFCLPEQTWGRACEDCFAAGRDRDLIAGRIRRAA